MSLKLISSSRSALPKKPSRYLGVEYFVHPIPMAAVLLLAINDHFLKPAYPGWLTGKLSDFAGIFFFPIFLLALASLSKDLVAKFSVPKFSSTYLSKMFSAAYGLRHLLVAIFMTDLVFIAVKVSPEARGVYISMLENLGFPSRVAPDLTDLISLTMNPLTWFYMQSQKSYWLK